MEKQPSGSTPDLSILRKILFWDTEIKNIDWQKHYAFVIKRVFERGNDDEKRELIRFYGEEKIKELTGSSGLSILPIFPQNKKR